GGSVPQRRVPCRAARYRRMVRRRAGGGSVLRPQKRGSDGMRDRTPQPYSAAGVDRPAVAPVRQGNDYLTRSSGIRTIRGAAGTCQRPSVPRNRVAAPERTELGYGLPLVNDSSCSTAASSLGRTFSRFASPRSIASRVLRNSRAVRAMSAGSKSAIDLGYPLS